MKPPRFIQTEIGLVLETAIPLSPIQREAARQYAEKEYRRRLPGLTGDRRAALVKVIEALRSGDFIERAVPANEWDKEALIYG